MIQIQRKVEGLWVDITAYPTDSKEAAELYCDSLKTLFPNRTYRTKES
jgi:hypothetical protein